MAIFARSKHSKKTIFQLFNSLVHNTAQNEASNGYNHAMYQLFNKITFRRIYGIHSN
jgi:hypothetical protein